MDDTIVWIIIIAFYAPLHYLPPILLILFNTHTDQRKASLIRAIIDCTISMAGAFILVYLVGLEDMTQAMMILLAAVFLPYLRVVKVMIKNRKETE